MRNFLRNILVMSVLTVLSLSGFGQACTPTYTQACSSNDFINNFSTTNGTTNITNLNTGCTGTLPTNLTSYTQTVGQIQGLNFNFTVQGGTQWSQGFRMFIDWNQDGDFLDPTEDVWNSVTWTTNAYTGTITVPFTATPGTCKMRIVCRYAQVPITPCDAGSFGEAEEYNVQVIPATPCTTVNAGTAVAAPSAPCPGSTFNLNLTGNTLASGLSYLWLQSTGGPTGPWDTLNPSVVTQSANITAPTQQTWYSCVVTCAASTNFDTSAAVSVTAQPWSPWSPCFCYTSTATNTFDTDIGQVVFGTLANPTLTPAPQNNQAAATGTYSNYDTLLPIPNYIKGYNYPLSITQISSGNTMYNSWAKVFIDFNHNTVFTDPGEEIFSLASNAGNTYNPSNPGVTIPTGLAVLSGLTRMRVVLREGGTAATTDPCGPYTWGETEDYVVNILDAGPYDPAVTNIQVSPTGGCMDSNGTVVVTLTNFGNTDIDLSVNNLVINLNVTGPNGTVVYSDTLDPPLPTLLQANTANNQFSIQTNVNFYDGGCYEINTDTLILLGLSNSNLVNDSLFNAIQVCNSRPNNGGDYYLCLNDTIPATQGLSIINCPTGLVQDSVLIPFTVGFAGNTPPNPTQCAAVGAGAFATGTLPTLPPGANMLSGEISVSNLQLAPLTFTTGPNLTRFSLYNGDSILPTAPANVYHTGLQGNLSLSAFGCIPGNPVFTNPSYLSTPPGVDLNNMYNNGVPVSPTVGLGHWSTNRCTATNILANCGGTTVATLKIVYEYVPMGVSWYEQPSGGVRISDSSVLDPLNTPNSIVTNSATAGTYTFYGACAADTNCRVASNLIIQGISIDSVSFTNVSCNGDSSGTAYIQGSGGNTGLYYTITGSITDTNLTGQFINLPSGTYALNVHDSVGCRGGDSSITITEPPALVIDSITSTTPTCAPGSDASMSVYASGGTGVMPYDSMTSDNAPTIIASSTFNNLSGGVTHLVTVYDQNGCTDTMSHAVIQPIAPTWNVVTADTVNCFGDSTGTITVSTNPGTHGTIIDSIIAPLAWAQQIAGGTVSGLPAGTYTLRSTDGNNCSIDTMITIATPTPMVWTSAVTDSVDCNGDSTGSIVVTSTGGTGTPHTYSISPIVGTQAPSGTFNNLNAQTFTVTAMDSNSCTIDTALTISEPVQLSIDTVSVTHVGCNGDSTGIIVLTSAGGTGNVTYSTPAPGSQGPAGTITGLPIGTYTITGTDQNGCTGTTSVTITEPPVLVINSVVVDSVACNGDTTGSVTITLGGGSPAYVCTISPNVGSQQSPGDFTGLPAGVYTINCSDANGCTISTTATVFEPTPLQYTSVASTNVSCAGANDGMITATGTGGTGNLTYSINPANGTQPTAGNFIGLSGTTNYTLTLTDINNCTLDSMLTITEPVVLTIDTVSTIQVACNGDTSGQIIMTSAGGTNPVSYTISPSATQGSSGTFTGLGAGTYIITGTDSNNCVAMDTVVITEPSAVTITNVTSTVPSCVPGCDATMTITASGGTGTLNYNDGTLAAPGQLSNVFTNQCAGLINITVTDANGCTDTTSHTITTPGAPSWNAITATPVLCFGDNNGTITLTTTGGTGTIWYFINGPVIDSNTTGIFNGLPTGNYILTARDVNNCSITSNVMVSTPAALSYASIAIDSVDCNGACDGSITVTGAGGIMPYTYQITAPTSGPSNTTGIFTALCANTYTVQLTDSNNCTYDTMLTVAEPAVLAISNPSTTNILCNGDSTGVITMGSTGGTGTTTYTISPNVGNQGPNGTFTNLPADTYLITGTDQNSCTDTMSVTLTEPSPLVIDSIVSTTPTCVPGCDAMMTVYASGGNNTSYTYNNGTLTQIGNNIFSNQCAANYTITVTDANGCSVTGTHVIATPGSPTWASVTDVDVLCNGDSTGSISAVVTPGNDPNITTTIILPIVWNGTAIPASNLPANAYTIQAVDGNGCNITSVVNITEPPALVINSTLVDSVDCNGDTTGSIAVGLTGGTGTYTCTISPNVGSQQTAGTFTGLPQGIYTISCSDANNCTVSTTLQVHEPPALSYTSVASTNVSCFGANDGTITATGTGGTPPLAYAVTPPPAVQGLPGSFTGLNGGSKTLTLSDANGCTLDSNITIIEPALFTIDTMSAMQVLCFGDSSGQLVMTSAGGTTINPVTYVISPVNGSTQGPNGTFSNLPADTYTITATDNNGCTAVQAYTITQPASAVVITNVGGTPPTCVPGNDGTITITASGGTPGLQYSLDQIIWQSSNTFSNLGASGTYFVYVRDTNNCQTQDSITLTTPGAPVWTSVTSTTNTCNGDSTGTITAVATGTGTITYSISPDPNGVSPINPGNFINLPADNYNVTASDANGCSVIQAITVNEPPAIQFTSVITDSVDCNGDSDGSITVTSTGGTGQTHAYQLILPLPASASNTTGIFNTLAANTYTLQITDSNSCTMDSVITVSEPPLLTIDTTSLTTVLCRGDSSGQIVMIDNGGTGNVTYVISPTVPNVTQLPTGTFNNLPAGMYTVTATDQNSCTAVATYTVTEPATNVVISNVTGTTPTCNPGGDGTVTITAAGGTGGLMYTLSPTYIISQLPSTFNSLNSGTYLATAIDANGCTDTITYVLGGSPIPTWGIVSTTDALCNGDSTGTITAPGVGGTAPLSYSIIAPTNFIQTNGTGNFSGLPADTYTVQLTDSQNCSIDTMLTINEPTALSFASLTSDSVSCNGLSDGQVVALGAGGAVSTSAPYSYTIAPNTGFQLPVGTFNSLPANTYTVTLTDSNMCTFSSPITVYEPTPIVIDSASSIDVLCNGDSSGSIYVQSSGGTGSIYHVIGTDTNLSNPATFLNYAAGNYTISAIDANGCSTTTNVMISQPPPLTHSVSSTNVLCFGDTTGTITMIGSGGTPYSAAAPNNYTYAITPPAGSQQTRGSFSGLGAGNYVTVVIDSNGCTDSSSTITITEPTQIVFGTATTQNIDCFGDSTGSIGIAATGGTGVKMIGITAGPVTRISQASPASFSNLPAGTYTLTVTDGNGCTETTSITLTQNPQLFFSSITNREEICFGDSTAEITFQGAGGVGPYTYVFNNGIAPGSITPSTQTVYGGLTTNVYNIEVIDALGCTYDSLYQLLGPERINFPVFEITPTTCLDTEDGKLTVEAAGGRGGRYTYSLEPGFYVNTNGIFRDLAPLNYTLRTTDTAGCFIDTTLDIPLPSNPLVVSITKEDLGCHGRGNEAWGEAIATGGTPPYTYLWSSTPVQTTARASDLYQGIHTVDVVDAQGCLERDTIVIEPGPCCQEVFLPNAFSPNGDGRNDEFRILSSAGMELQQFEVRNRWGIKIWETYDLRGSWDGLYGDKPVDVGSYYYILRYKCLTDGQNYMKKGDVIVVR